MCRIGVVEYFLSIFTFSEDNFLLVSATAEHQGNALKFTLPGFFLVVNLEKFYRLDDSLKCLSLM